MFNSIKTFYYNLIHLPRNLRKWAKFVWTDRDWDWEYLSRAMRIKLDAMIVNNEKFNDCVSAPKNIKRMKDLRDALKRLEEDEYDMETYEKIFPDDNQLTSLSSMLSMTKEQLQKMNEHIVTANKLKKDDLKTIAKNIKYVEHWWN
jgi:hypothetical protein